MNTKHQRKNLKSLFLVHGEHETQKEYKEYLLQKGFKKVEIPKIGQEIELKYRRVSLEELETMGA